MICILALRCTWVRRLISQQNPWNYILNALYKKDISKCIVDFGDEMIELLIKSNKNYFWNDVFYAWKTLLNKQHDGLSSLSDFCKMPFFYNSSLKTNKKSILIQTWYNKGVRFVNDFFSIDGKLLTKSDFEKKFKIQPICFLKYHGILKSIKAFIKLKNLVHDTSLPNIPFIPYHLQCILKNCKGCKDMYKILRDKTILPIAIQKWNNALLNNIDHNNWQTIFKIPYKITNDTSLHWLQYRILHRILPTKQYLKKIKKIENDFCEFCGQESEDIMHLFFNCNHVTVLWRNLSDIIKTKTDISVELTLCDIIFGITNDENNPLNYIILASKQYIYYSSKKKCMIHIKGLLNFLHHRFQAEQFNAKKSYNFLKFQTMWIDWKDIFST